MNSGSYTVTLLSSASPYRADPGGLKRLPSRTTSVLCGSFPERWAGRPCPLRGRGVAPGSSAPARRRAGRGGAQGRSRRREPQPARPTWRRSLAGSPSSRSPVRPRRRSRPRRCPPSPSPRPPRPSEVAGPRNAEGQPPSPAARGEALPGSEGAGEPRPGLEPQVRLSPQSPTQLLQSDSGSPQARDSAARLQARNRCPGGCRHPEFGGAPQPQERPMDGLLAPGGTQGKGGHGMSALQGKCWTEKELIVVTQAHCSLRRPGATAADRFTGSPLGKQEKHIRRRLLV